MAAPCQLEPREGVVVHHWDADGIASAAMLVRMGYASKWLTPRIGVYRASAVPAAELRSASTVYVLDYGIPGGEYEELADKLEGRLIVVDHHRVEPWDHRGRGVYCNPVATGAAGERDYPATAYLLYRVLGSPAEHRDLAVVGVVGDTGAWLGDPEWRRWVEALAGDAIGLGEAVEVVRRVDACHRFFDEACVQRAVELLARGPGEVLASSYLDGYVERLRGVERVVEEKLTLIHDDGLVRVYELVLDAYVTGQVGRRLAAGHDGVVVLVHWVPRLGMGFIYVRSRRHRLAGAAERLRRRGLRVGGKDYVFVVEYDRHPPRGLLEHIVEVVREELERGGARG